MFRGGVWWRSFVQIHTNLQLLKCVRFSQNHMNFYEWGRRMGEGGGQPNTRTHTHTHTHTYISYAWWKNIFKTCWYFRKFVNICIINDLSYPPATHPKIIGMHFFISDLQIIHSAREYNRHPRISNAQITTASLGCEVAKLWGHMGWILSIVWEGYVFLTKSGNRTTLEYIDVIIYIMRFGPYKLREFYRRWM